MRTQAGRQTMAFDLPAMTGNNPSRKWIQTEREIKKLIFMYSAADPEEQETKLNHITKAASGEGAAFDFPENGAAWRKGANFTLRGGGYLLY